LSYYGRWGQPRRRPPWWPENEPFPPQGSEGRAVRGRFMRRMALFAIVGFFVFFLLLSVAIGVVLRILQVAGAGTELGMAIVLIGGVVLLFGFGRGWRRYARQLGDVIEAAGRIAEGDLSTRVTERGSREVRVLARAFNTMSARLEASEQQRRRLLADVSHELRTPLSVVQGNLEALLDGVHPADEDHLRAILDETRILSRLVEDLTTLSLAEAGALTLHREPTDVAAIARDTANSFGAAAEEAGVRVATTATPGLGTVDADPVRLREILTNLVGNAIRYTSAGGDVRVAVTQEVGDVVVTVTDTGAGISADALGHIFDRFYKSPESRGAGLGLAIAKQLVVAHGGTIVAKSEPGRGTEIRFTVPVERED